MLRLQERGMIVLPPPRSHHTPQARHLHRPAPVPVDDSPLSGSLAGLGPIILRQVRRTPQEQIFSGLIESHHYLGYRQPVGEHLSTMLPSGPCVHLIDTGFRRNDGRSIFATCAAVSSARL
jgi:hypothetical protein